MKMPDIATKLPVKTEAGSVKATEAGWSPFDNLRSEIDRLFDDFGPMLFPRPFGRLALGRSLAPSLGRSLAAVTAPAVDLVEKEKSDEITAELPGIDPKDVDVRIANGMLTIKGEKQESREEKNKEYHMSERRYGSFQRSFQLPDGVDAEKIEATFTNGVLAVRLPKTPEAQKSERKIAIKAA
jgi:HSP20 family protein